MSNVLKVSLHETICTLHGRGWSRRRIARELGIDRETVGRRVRGTAPWMQIAPVVALAEDLNIFGLSPVISNCTTCGNRGADEGAVS